MNNERQLITTAVINERQRRSRRRLELALQRFIYICRSSTLCHTSTTEPKSPFLASIPIPIPQFTPHHHSTHKADFRHGPKKPPPSKEHRQISPLPINGWKLGTPTLQLDMHLSPHSPTCFPVLFSALARGHGQSASRAGKDKFPKQGGDARYAVPTVEIDWPRLRDPS